MKTVPALKLMFPSVGIWIGLIVISLVPLGMYLVKHFTKQYKIPNRFIAREVAAAMIFTTALGISLATIFILAKMSCTITEAGNFCQLLAYPKIDDFRLYDANIVGLPMAFIGFCCLRNPPREILLYGLAVCITAIGGCSVLSYIT